MGTYPLERTFRDFYRELGGAAVLGPAIIEGFEWEGRTCQYTEKALLCFNPEEETASRYSLLALGSYLNLGELQISAGEAHQYEVYKEFRNLYKSLGGEKNVGRPLTPVRFNPLEERLEQYFDHVGFYRLIEDSPGQAHLLAYGVFICGKGCSYPASRGSAIASNPSQVEMPFLDTIARMDNPAAFGAPLTIPYQLENGQIQQVYDNAVFIGNSLPVETVRLLNIPVLLGYPVTPPVPQSGNSKPGLVFYNVDGANGYQVPTVFDQFIIGHGGREFSGDPIGEFYESGESYRQCFQNYCLEYQTAADNDKKVQMLPIGEEYLRVSGLPESYVVRFQINEASVALQTTSQFPMLSRSSDQTIQIFATRRQDGQPVPDVDFTITLNWPDGSRQEIITTPTDLWGATQVGIPTKADLPRGKVITYQACLNQSTGEGLCVNGHYLIW